MISRISRNGFLVSELCVVSFFPSSERTMGCFVNSPLCSIPIPVRFHSWWISFSTLSPSRKTLFWHKPSSYLSCADLGWTDDTDAPRPRVFTAKAIEAAPSHESQLSGRTAWTPWSKIEKKLLSQLIELNPPTAGQVHQPLLSSFRQGYPH